MKIRSFLSYKYSNCIILEDNVIIEIYKSDKMKIRNYFGIYYLEIIYRNKIEKYEIYRRHLPIAQQWLEDVNRKE